MGLKVQKITFYGFGCNTYALTADGKSAVIIDCADERVFDKLKELGLTPEAVLLTHGHFDHVGGCGKFYSEGVPIYCGANEKDFIFSAENRNIFGGVYIPDFKIAGTFKDGEKAVFAGIEFTVIETAGHTKGGVVYLAGDCLFTGDTLFADGIGRTDLPYGNARTLNDSIKKLFALKGDYRLFCGHGEESTLEWERVHNPYVY